MIARSLGHGEGPSASYHTLTSGVQPLIAFIIAPVTWFVHDPWRLLRIDLGFTLGCDVLLVVLLAFFARRVAGNVAGLIAGGIWALSPTAIRAAAGGLETTLALACAMGLLLVWLGAGDRPSRVRWFVVGFMAGVAVLARIDAVALVGLVVVVQFWRTRLRDVMLIALGGFVSLGPWWIYCWITFGTPIPQSGTQLAALAQGIGFVDSADIAGANLARRDRRGRTRCGASVDVRPTAS
ncbi:MAG: glycosyltransferase family 39 protein [Actinobacteria bacterium]|nr:glycosyltransferase family 39 protein [Actinomycetota bacterium]